MPRIALSIRDARLRRRLSNALRQAGIECETSSLKKLRETPQAERFDLLIASLQEATQLLGEQPSPDGLDVVALAGPLDAERDAKLMALGCVSVLSTELGDDLLSEALTTILNRRRQRLDEPAGTRRIGNPRLSDFVSASPVMQAFMSVVQRLVSSDASLLLTGETGVGKERLARAIHGEGPRALGPFVALNCAALSETLLESELFGHEAGAFTGALRARRGRFELAHHGTIFLDEIAEMPSHLQAKLLQVLQSREFHRLGGEAPIAVDVRVMAATNLDLALEVEQGRFRRDLFFRLGVVTLNVPPLRERREDIPHLVSDYIAHFRRQLPHGPAGISAEALDAMQHYDWPGNVRELINVVERAMLLAGGEQITLEDLGGNRRAFDPAGLHIAPPTAQRGANEESINFSRPHAISNWTPKLLKEARQEVIDQFERQYLQELLAHTEGRVGKAARLAGVRPRWLYEKMRRLGLKKENFRPK